MIAWLGALVVGLSLGLLGSGGSILTVPILVYALGEPEKAAIAESLAIVALIAAAAAVPAALGGRIAWSMVARFGLPGMAGSYLGAALSRQLPASWQLLGFAAVVLTAATMMLRPWRAREASRPRPSLMALEGLAVGTITGLVGVGGGFLIVPALVLLGGLSMQRAAATSLAIIVLSSSAGFYKYLDVLAGTALSVSWRVVALFAVVGAVGSLAGGALSQRLPQAALRRAFAILLLGIGTFVVLSASGVLAR